MRERRGIIAGAAAASASPGGGRRRIHAQRANIIQIGVWYSLVVISYF